MSCWLRDLSIAKKLYALVGMIVILIVIEVFTLQYAITTLSAMRAFVEGCGHWNNGQKNAVINLYNYAATSDESFYQAFQKNLIVPAGYKKARIAMEACPDINNCPELFARAEEGFREGLIPERDIANLIRLVRHLKTFSHMDGGAALWVKGDGLLDSFVIVGDDLHQELQRKKPDPARLKSIMAKVNALNIEFSGIQTRFSARIAQGSQSLERVLMILLIFALFSVASLTVYVIYRLVTYFKISIEEINEVACKVGHGDLTQRVTVRSKDSLGLMVEGLNKMIEDLQTSIGQREQAESASQVKTLFLANMSHEVRTPLGVILGLIDVLKESGLTEDERLKYMGVIEQTGHNLQQIINDILDISKVEAGHLDIHKSQFSLSEFIDELAMNLQLLAARGKNRLIFQSGPNLPETIVSDRLRLRQILTNLIGNALKFTMEGEVTVRCEVHGQQLFFRISDSGIGIPEKERDRLFKPFSQVDHASNRKYGGTGLGLLLSKRLAQSMGGDIRLESSQPGVGSVFVLTQPVAQNLSPSDRSASVKEGKGENFHKLKGKRILLVEDSLDNQMLVQLFLGKKDVTVEFANNGAEGIEKATHNQYDLILMDMQMPVVDGYTATEELRHRGFSLPIIALTAHAMKEDRERCMRVGCNDYMTKPIDKLNFYRTLTSHL